LSNWTVLYRTMLPTVASMLVIIGTPPVMTASSAGPGTIAGSQLPGSCQLATPPIHVLVSADALAAKPNQATTTSTTATPQSHPCNTVAILSAPADPVNSPCD
jgi:hypothetical protein